MMRVFASKKASKSTLP